MSTSSTSLFSSSTDIPHPLISDCPSTDVLNSGHPLIASATPSMDITHSLMVSTQITNTSTLNSSVEDLVAVQSLLGLREGSEIMSERVGWSQAKGELESTQMHAISSSMAKESERSPTLVGEGKGVSGVSQGSP